MSTFNHGGQRRTAKFACGFTARGAPKEVDAKVARHYRYCDACGMKGQKADIPAFSTVNAGINGWDGLLGGGHTGLSSSRACITITNNGLPDEAVTNLITTNTTSGFVTEQKGIALSDEKLEQLFSGNTASALLPTNKKAKKAKK
jgi:hypothetical protein